MKVPLGLSLHFACIDDRAHDAVFKHRMPLHLELSVFMCATFVTGSSCCELYFIEKLMATESKQNKLLVFFSCSTL